MNQKKFEKKLRKAQKAADSNKILLVLNAFDGGLTADEIIGAVPIATLAIIKRSDANPFFRAFAIAHEGTITPRVSEKKGTKFGDMVQATIRVVRDAVESMKVRRIGVPFYDDYHEDGTRTEIGREVAQIHKEINGNLHAISVVYGPPETREILKDRDVVSMETNQAQVEDGPQGLIMKAIGTIDAVATGRSIDGVEPAWAGAVAMGQVYGFSAVEKPTKEEKQDGNYMADDIVKRFRLRADGMIDVASMAMSDAVETVRDILRGKNMPISDIFSFDAIFGKRDKTGTGETVWHGGDEKMRGELFEFMKVQTAPMAKQLETANDWKKDIIELRTQDFKQTLLKAAIEEAPKNKFDEKWTKILLTEIAGIDPKLDESVLLTTDVNVRKAWFDTRRGELLKGAVDKTRTLWQTVEGEQSPVNGDGAAPTGGGAPAPAGVGKSW